MDYNYQNANYSFDNEPDYYEIYTQKQIKTARGVFSRFNFALLAYIIIAFAVSFVAELSMIIMFGMQGAVEFIKEHIYIEWLLSFLPMYVIALPCFFIMVKDMKTMSVEKSKISIAEFFSFFLIAELLMSVGNTIGNTLNSFFGIIKGEGVTDHTSELISSMPVWLTIIVVVIIGPIVEEIIFRKLMIDRLSRYGSAVAVIVSSVAFGLFHGNLYQFFYAALVGLVFSFIYAKTRNIIYPIAMHMMVNFFGAVAVMPVISKMTEIEEALLAIEAGAAVEMGQFFKNLMIVGSYTVIQYAIMVGGIVMLYKFIKHKKYRIRDSWEYKLPRERAAGIIVMNAGTLAFIFVSVLLFAFSVIM